MKNGWGLRYTDTGDIDKFEIPADSKICQDRFLSQGPCQEKITYLFYIKSHFLNKLHTFMT